MSHHIIETGDLYFSYPDGTCALNGVSFKISHGESVAIVGANGAGKSTLLCHLNGYHLPSKGVLKIGDHIVSGKTLSEVRSTVGMVFQNPDDQLFMPTVYDDVAFGPLNLGLEAEEVESRVESALRTVRSLHLKDRPPYKLSGGEKRCVAIASVLSMAPNILVLDEPTSNLDPLARQTLIDLLKTFDHTKIIATHDLDMAIDLCERTIVLRKGKVIEDGNTLDLFSNKKCLSYSNLEMPLKMQSCPCCEGKCNWQKASESVSVQYAQ